MSASQRNKGKRGERLLAQEVREAFPEFAEQVKRGWQARRGSDDPDVAGLPGIWFEHKSGAKPNVRAALAQAIEETDDRMPVAVIRDDRKPPFAVLRLSDLFTLIRKGI